MTASGRSRYRRGVECSTPSTSASLPSGGTGTIADFVWHDLDGDGVQDALEPGIEGVLVELWLDVDGDGAITPGLDNLVRTEVTDVNGNYEFKALPAGDYVVQVAAANFDVGGVLESFVQTHDPDQFGGTCTVCDDLGSLTLGAGAGDFDQDFGYAASPATVLSISGLVFDDQNGNAVFDSGTETETGGATLRLYRDVDGDGILDPGEPQIGVTTSDGVGAYQFTDLPPGDYIVTVDTGGTVLEDYIQTTQQGGGFPENGVQPVTLVAADSTGNDFGFWGGQHHHDAGDVGLLRGHRRWRIR